MTSRIEVSERTFQMLQELAEPFVDTPETVIVRLIQAFGDQIQGSDEARVSELNSTGFAPDSPPNLTFTRLRTAKVGGTALPKPNWAQLVRHLHGLGLQKIGFDELQRVSAANIVKGLKSGDGYAYIHDLGISMQGEDAKDCWSIALGLARHLSIPLSVEFEWRNKIESERPGQSGSMSWEPKRRGQR